MKKLLVAFTFVCMFGIVYSQVDTFFMEGKVYQLRIGQRSLSKDSWSLFITCDNTFNAPLPIAYLDAFMMKEEYAHYVELEIYADKIDGFRNFLMETKNKYEKWCSIATENNVTSLFKTMDINSGKYGCHAVKKEKNKVYKIFYNCYESTYANCVSFSPDFSVKDSIKSVWMSQTISNADEVSFNPDKVLYSEIISLRFNSLEEINSLIKCLSKDNLNILKDNYLIQKKQKEEEKEREKEIYDKFD